MRRSATARRTRTTQQETHSALQRTKQKKIALKNKEVKGHF